MNSHYLPDFLQPEAIILANDGASLAKIMALENEVVGHHYNPKTAMTRQHKN